MIHMHRKFNDDIFARCLVIMKNVIISFIKECRGPTLRPPCDVIDDVIIMKLLSFGIIWDDLVISEVKLKLCLIFQNFQNCHCLELATNFFTGSYTEKRIDQKDSHEHFRHFELLIDALAQILTEIYDFQNLTYFVTWWRHRWRHECVKMHDYKPLYEPINLRLSSRMHMCATSHNELIMHYNGVIMSAMASQITSLTIVFSIVYCRSKKASKLRVTGLCEGNSPVTSDFPLQKASNAENIYIWWRHHE